MLCFGFWSKFHGFLGPHPFNRASRAAIESRMSASRIPPAPSSVLTFTLASTLAPGYACADCYLAVVAAVFLFITFTTVRARTSLFFCISFPVCTVAILETDERFRPFTLKSRTSAPRLLSSHKVPPSSYDQHHSTNDANDFHDCHNIDRIPKITKFPATHQTFSLLRLLDTHPRSVLPILSTTLESPPD